MKVDELFASRLARAYLDRQLHRRTHSDAVQDIRHIKEALNLPNRELDACYILRKQRQEYYAAVRRLQARAEIIDRNLHDLYFVYPKDMLDKIIDIIETTRWQFRLLLSTQHRSIFILPLDTVKQYTIGLMNAELIALAVEDFDTAIYTKFRKQKVNHLYDVFSDALYRFLCVYFHPIVGAGDIEEEMHMRLQLRPRNFEVTIRPVFSRTFPCRVDVYPCADESAFSTHSDASPMPSDHPSLSQSDTSSTPVLFGDISNTATPDATGYCPKCTKSFDGQTNPRHSKRRRNEHDAGREHSAKKHRADLPNPLTPPPYTVVSIPDDEYDSDSGLGSSDNWSLYSVDSDELSDDTAVVDVETYQPEQDAAPRHDMSLADLLPVPRLQLWWSVVKDIFRTFTP